MPPEQRVVLLTGGSAGIGYEAALAFARRGDRVGATARRLDRLEKLKAMPHVIGIAGGEHKVDAIKGALRGRFIHTLITDERIALRLLKP